MESILIANATSRKLNIRKLAEPNLIKCPGCCSASFCDATNLRQHLQELQDRLNSIQCYACGESSGGLETYINHLKVCPSVNTPNEDNITKIECRSFDKNRVEKQRASKLVASSGLKIIVVPDLPESIDHSPKIIKVLTPIASTIEDRAKIILPSKEEKVTRRKRPLETKQPDEASCAKNRATVSCALESSSDHKTSLELGKPFNDAISDGDDDDVSECEDHPLLGPASENISLANAIPLEVLHTPTAVIPAKISKEIVYKCKKCEFKTTKIEEQKKHHCSPTNCPYCDRTFKNNIMAGPHIKKHKLDALESDFNILLKKGGLSKDSRYCQKCNKNISITVLDLHHKIHGEGGGFYNCATCKQFFVAKYSLIKHSKDGCTVKSTLPTKMFRCTDCSVWFDSLPELVKHNKIMHKDLSTCFICGVPFKSRVALLKHVDTNHKKLSDQSAKSKPYECHICYNSAPSMTKYAMHLIKHHPEIEKELSAKAVAKGVCTAYCTVCKYKVKDGELHNKLHSNKVQVYSCVECPQKFILQERMIRHALQVHKRTVSREYKCDECPNTYNTLTYLMSHTVAKNHSSVLLEGHIILKCRFCLKPHLRAREMYFHEKAHEEKGDTPVTDPDPNANYDYVDKKNQPHKCTECSKISQTKLKAEVHAVAKNHMEGFEYLQPLTCYFCAKRFVRKLDMKRHMGAHIEGNQSCEICGKKFPTACTLRKHAVVHARFICCFCKKPKVSEQELLEHTRTDHKDLSKGMVKCNFCVKYFANKDHLKEHYKSTNHIESQMNETLTFSNDLTFCEVCNECVSADLKEYHAVLHSKGVEKLFKCPACPKQFCTVTNLGMHAMVEHDSTKRAMMFACTKCPTTTTSCRGLANHYQNHLDDSANAKPFACKYCSKAFRRSSDCRKHELIHEGSKDHACTLCPKTFRLAHLLTLHMRTHTNERPYQCSMCENSFKAYSALRNHKMSKHQSERPHVCSYCSKTFKTRGALGNHVGMHEMLFKCNDCGRTFASRHAATIHIKKIHLVKDREVFVCIICNATYGRSLFLAQHMKTHGQLASKGDLVQHLMEMSCERQAESHHASRTTPKRTRKKKSVMDV